MRRFAGIASTLFSALTLPACGGGSDKQGDFQSAVRDFLRTEELAAYPNTGVIFAASSESETQEWSRWESGIFSHELRSALLGGADVDGDGRITYQEAAAFVEAANAAIDVPRARLRVFSRPPAMRNSLALMETAAFTRVPSLVVDAQHAGRYHVEDVRGVRIADLNSSPEQPVRLALVGKAPFYLRTANREAVIPAGDNVEVRTLRLEAAGGATRGSVETSFRAHLFEIAFGLGFYHGVLVSLGEEQLDLDAALALVGRHGGAGTPEAGLGREGTDLLTVLVQQPRLGAVVQEGAAVVPELDLLPEADVVHGRVPDDADAGPAADDPGERDEGGRQVRVDLDRHGATPVYR